MPQTIYDPIYERLIDFLISRRQKLNLTQSDVASALGVCRTWVGKVEQRERRLDVLELWKIAHVYRLDFSDLEKVLNDEGG